MGKTFFTAREDLRARLIRAMDGPALAVSARLPFPGADEQNDDFLTRGTPLSVDPQHQPRTPK